MLHFPTVAILATMLLASPGCGQAPGTHTLAIGGYGGGASQEIFTDTELLRAGEVCAANLPDLPPQSARYGAAAAVIDNDNLILWCGGTDVTNGNSDQCISLDLRLDFPTWDVYDPMSERRVFAAAVAVADKMYVLGGFSDRFGTELSSVESTTTDSGGVWTTEGAMTMPEVRQKHCAVRVPQTGIIFVAGGISYSSAMVYDTEQAGSGWIPVPPMSTDKYDHACAYVMLSDGSGEGILTTGGASFTNEYLAVTEIFDWDRQEWRQLGDLYAPRNSHGLGVIEGVPTAFGGYDFIPTHDGGSIVGRAATDIIEEYSGGAWVDSRLRMSKARLYFAQVDLPPNAVSCK